MKPDLAFEICSGVGVGEADGARMTRAIKSHRDAQAETRLACEVGHFARPAVGGGRWVVEPTTTCWRA